MKIKWGVIFSVFIAVWFLISFVCDVVQTDSAPSLKSFFLNLIPRISMKRSAFSHSDYQEVSLETLAGYEYQDPNSAFPNKAGKFEDVFLKTLKNQVPEAIRKLNGKKVRISGFMVPLSYDPALTSESLLVRVVPGCIFCQMPRLNDRVSLTIPPGVKSSDEEELVEVFGTFEVGEKIENGYVANLYRMTVDEVGEAPPKIQIPGLKEAIAKRKEQGNK